MARFQILTGVRARFAIMAALVLVAVGTTAPAQAGFISFEAAGANAAAITPTRDAFRAAVGGGSVAGANGSFGGLRREINWDGVPEGSSDPNLLPANFFNANSPRGVVFHAGHGLPRQRQRRRGLPRWLFERLSDFQLAKAVHGRQQ
jgi:hypothetical protein